MPSSPARNAADSPAGQDGGRQNLWVASDGTAGMRLQAVALATAMLRARPGWSLDEFTISPHRLIRTLPRLAAAVPGLPLYGAKGGVALQRRPHAGRYPDILITCGRRMAGYALALRRRARAAGTDMRIVHIQDPRLPPAMFDALVVPRHDPARGPNVLVSTGSLNRLTLTDIKTAMMEMPSRWLSTTRGMSVAVMLGGDNRRYRISEAMAGRMAERLTEFAGATGALLIPVASRRTPEAVIDGLAAALPPDRVMLPRKGEANIYPGVLGMAQAVIVTSDSVNMASEAAITGKPVMIAPWLDAGPGNPSGESGRIRAFHDAMFAARHTAALTPAMPSGAFERLDEMDGLSGQLLDLLGH